jgi:AcrR family transcriptional regulator
LATRLTRAERAAATRRDLLEVAERRFFADGYHGTRLDDIAEEAGYTKGAVYSAYHSKAGLFLALYDRVVDQRIREIRELLSAHQTEDDRLDALALQPVDDRNGRFLVLAIEFLTHAARDGELLDAIATRHDNLRASLAELAPSCGPLSPQAWAATTLALSNGLALERLINPRGVPDDLMASVQRSLLRSAGLVRPGD